MKVIFKKTNEVKDVSPGYALNYLIPQGLAVVATEKEIKKLEIEKLRETEKREQREIEDMALVKRLSQKTFSIKAKAGKGGKLFGAVTKAKICEVLEADPKKVEVLLEKPIKKTGRYKIDLKIGNERARIDLLIKNSK